ncbi:MAG: valine--tRNA ligase [Planctomycetes bacterium]|nr:valine--tRNA ligase [Planctomycetota bacterium]
MTTDMDTRYEPQKVEADIYRFWEQRDAFRAVVDRSKVPYTIVIPPPNVTGALHMGHGLNNTIQDLLIRFERKRGKAALWLPGTDHAGIATQNVVEKQLMKTEGKRRQQLGREAFLERVWAWKNEYGDRILQQLRRMGSSCDWSRTRFTLDDGLARAVRHNFVKLYREGLIFRGKRIINWCPRCETALADDEVEKPERDGHLWHIKYPVKGKPGTFVTVATSRPETMLGDLGVAVHPDDERYAALRGATLVLPLLQREIPLFTDTAVEKDFGTGAVKVTPSHDPNDFEMGARAKLGLLRVMDDRAVINEHGGPYAGLKREEARKRIVADLDAAGLLVKIDAIKHAVGQCYRCDTIVEPIESLQWFVKMRPLADLALAALERGEPQFHPSRWAEFYKSWLVDVRDWCISRQLWWGHRIPVLWCSKGHEFATEDVAPTQCPTCGDTSLRQDEDVLDTWFSSALWPFSTLGWPEKTDDLEFFYPTDTLSTDRGIIFFWVARMVMMGLHNVGKIPFKHVNIHSTVLDEKGRKMSKSLGNGIDPLEIIDGYGADAMRYSLIDLTVEGQDTKLSITKFEKGRNFANKMWNAARFAILKVGEGAVTKPAMLTDLADRWILSRLRGMVGSITDCLADFRFNEAAREMYTFTWNHFCDWYLEIAKSRLEPTAAPESREAARFVVATVLRHVMHVSHPIMPYITERIWQVLRQQNWFTDLEEACITARWPDAATLPYDAEADARVDYLQELVRGIRNARARNEVELTKTVDVHIAVPSATERAALDQAADWVEKLAKAKLTYAQGLKRPPDSDVEVIGSTELFLSLAGLIDVGKQRANLEKAKAKLEGAVKSVDAKLGNAQFREKAPAEVIASEEKRRDELKAELAKVLANLDALPKG